MGQPGQTSLSERLRSIEAEIGAGRAESALARCQEIFAHYPRAIAVQRTLGEIYLALHKPREALGALDRALAGDPEDARACCARAVIHQMHGDPNAALAWYRRACDARPDDQSLRATYRDMASRLGLPPYQPTRVGLARLYMRGALFTHAIREWETLIAENSDLLEAQVGLVETLWRVERTQEAEEWARRVLMNAPACVKPLLIVGVIARETDRPTEAERYLQRAAELDPDHRIARALFADRAIGDAGLRALFWGDEPVAEAFGQGARGTFAPSLPGGQRASNGPRQQTGLPAYSASAGVPLSGVPSLADLGNALSRPDLSANLSRSLTGNPQNLPPEFHSMFKETENMLWAPDGSDPGAAPTMAMPAPMQPPMPPPAQTGAPFMPPVAPQSPAPLQPPMPAPQSGRLDPQPFESSSQFVPPAIAESQFALGDTETRRAIRWVQWLQAQGARTRNDEPQRGRPTGSLDALFGQARQEPPPAGAPGAPPPYPFNANGRGAQLPVTSLPSTGPTGLSGAPSGFPSSGSLPSGALSSGALSSGALASDALSGPSAPPPHGTSAPLTGPQPQPQPNELREMFAQLDPGLSTGAQPNPRFSGGETGAPAANAANTANVAEGAWPEALADAFEWPSQPGVSSPGAQPPANATAAPDLTLEALEGAHSAEGYQPFTLEPGALAAFADGDANGRQPSAAPAGETARALDTFFQGPEEPPLAPPAPPAEPAPAEPSAPAISPTDYPARLAEARSLRESGALDDALVEYRALLKHAPDLLPDVLSDLEAALDEQPEHPELHRLLGDARIRQGDYMAALESLNRSVSLTQPTDE